MVRIALLDDHPAIVAGLRRLIAPEPDLEVVVSASDAARLARRLDGRRADVIVLDHQLARDDGLAACARIKSRPDAPAVVIYSAHAGPGCVIATRAAQADAVVDKSAPVRVVLDAIRTVASGGTYFPAVTPDAYAIAVARLEDDDLPVFAMLLDGDRPGTIAEALRIDDAEARRRAKRIVSRLQQRPRSVAGRTTAAPPHSR
jgi:DNA-binding NarL/FixJ family response regulator